MSWQVVNLQPLASGGNAEVQVGRRSDTGEPVVVKFLREYHLHHARKAFEREVRILARGLPRVAPVLGAWLDVEQPCYVMPYYAGGSLKQYAGRFTTDQLHIISNEVALALSALHGASVAHGDVKPDNILLSQDGRLSISDPLGNGFGCTMLFSEHSGGTPGYWAPEVRARGPISYAGDIYSYGATLYELLTGIKPQDGQRFDQISQHDGYPPDICQIISACCQSDPNARPSLQDVFRMLRGEQWAAIKAAREQRQGLLKAACVLGGILVLGIAMSAES